MSNTPDEDDGAIDIMANRRAFVNIEPTGKSINRSANPNFNQDVEANQRKEIFAMASNASISFESTNQFFDFLEQARGYLTTGTVPGAPGVLGQFAATDGPPAADDGAEGSGEGSGA